MAEPFSRVGAYCPRNPAFRRQAGTGGTPARRVRPRAAQGWLARRRPAEQAERPGCAAASRRTVRAR